MMPEAMLPAIPSALNHCLSSSLSAEDTPAAAPRAALEGVVVILAVRGGAVAQRHSGNIEAARMADKGTDAGFRGRAKRCLQIIAVARGHAQTGNVHQNRIAHARHGDGKGWRHAGEGGSELLRDRKFRKSHRYSCSFLIRLRSCWRERPWSSARSHRRCTCRTAVASSA